MFDFNTIKEVSLAKGGHFRAADGMCFMEMAAWFAGEEHTDKPECVSTVLGKFGIVLNDNMEKDTRDLLLKPLIPLVVGTYDPENELRRAEFLVMWVINKILPLNLRLHGYDKLATLCESADNLTNARVAVKKVWFKAPSSCTEQAELSFSYFNLSYYSNEHVVTAAGLAITAAAQELTGCANRQIWETAVEGLRQAILIGRHDGFDASIDLTERHKELCELVSA